MRYLAIILILYSHTVFSQNNAASSLSMMEEYTKTFGIQFAYNPEIIESRKLTIASDIDGLRSVFRQAKIEVLEISEDRWLLKSNSKNTVQKSTFVSGNVSDSEGQPLVSALLYTGSGESSALTDDNGDFIIELKEGVEQICCQYLGYKVQCVKNGDHLNFELTPISILMDDVKIETKKVQCSLSPIEDAEKLALTSSPLQGASLGKDILRTVQILSGIDATNDLSSSLSIRSASGLQSLVTMDGIPLYNTENSFGMFSVLNPLAVTEATLYKNTMPLEYGEFTGGYLACEGLGKIADKLKVNIDINNLQTLGSAQIPLGKSTQISGALRRSNGRISNRQYYSALSTQRRKNNPSSQAFNRPVRVSTALENRFGDAYFNFSHEWKGENRLSFTLFGNRDESGTSYEDDYLLTRNSTPNKKIEESYQQAKSKNNRGLSLRYHKTFKSEAEFQLMFYSSSYSLVDIILSNVSFKTRQREQFESFNSTINNSVQDRNFKIQYLSDRKKLWSLKVGADLRRLKTDFEFLSQEELLYEQRFEVPSFTPYAGLRYNFKDKVIADFGLRNAIIIQRDPISFLSPRAKLAVRLKEGLFLKSSASYNQQFFRPIELERQLGQSTSANIISNGRNIPIMQSAQLTLGLNYFKDGFKINGDFFIRENMGILEQVLVMPGIGNQDNVFGNNSYKLFEGINTVAGLDISAGYQKGLFTGLLSYTLSKSEDRFSKLFNNKPLPDQNNRTHQLNLFSSFDLGDWTVSTTYIYGSGVYTLNRAALGQNTNRDEIEPSDIFSQLPSYHRFDFNASYKVKIKRGALFFDIGIFNIMDNDNVNSEIYIYSLEDENKSAIGASEVNLLGRIWTLGVRYQL